MMLQFERVVATGTAALDSGIGDTALKTFNGDVYLYSVTGFGGGFASWRLSEGAGPTLIDQQLFGPTITYQIDRDGMPVTLGGSDQLILDVNTATGLVGYGLNSDGTIGALQETGTLVGGGDISALAQLTITGGDILLLAHEDTGQIGTYDINPDGSLSSVGFVSAQFDSMQVLQSGGNPFLIGADAASSTVAVYSVNQTSGTLSQIDTSYAIDVLGIGTPTVVETIEAYGESWIVIAGSASNSLSVLRLSADGSLSPTDHALDTLHTRFGAVQDMAVVEVDGRVFVVAGGGDDGIALFTMTTDGKLIHLDSFADTLSSGLQNVETLSVAHVGDELQIFVGAQEDAGLTQLTVSVADLGIVVEDFGTVNGTAQDDMLAGGFWDSTLLGGAGDDILIAGMGETTMTGGAGADIFAMRSGVGNTVITDFEPGVDQLDLTAFPFLRSPAQLTVTSTTQGAEIHYRDEVIEVQSASGGPLTSVDIFGAGFDGADHIPVDLFTGPDTNTSSGTAGPVSVDSTGPNPGLTDAEVQFSLDAGPTVTAQADDQGVFDLGLPDGTYSGHLDLEKYYSTAGGEITALDALQVLRISVGLDPTWGPATPEALIAADITQDGTINALDALSILQVAVGQTPSHDAKWVFLDANTDLSGITATNVDYDTGIQVTAVDNVLTADMTSILLGNVEAI